jgi:hypothetical protein
VNLTNFFTELKQRNVYKVAVDYADDSFTLSDLRTRWEWAIPPISPFWPDRMERLGRATWPVQP